MPHTLKLLFMGTPEFAVPALKALHEAGHRVLAAYTQPPRPAHRGQKETPSPVQRYAEAHGIPVLTPASLKDPATHAAFRAHGADAAIVAAYGLLLPQQVLDGCPLGCINIHPSLLPRWRGAAPIQRTLMAGDTETGICIMQMEAGLDTGPVLSRERITIPAGMNAGELHDLLAARAAPLLLATLDRLAEGRITPEPQAETGVTYAQKITKEECRLDWKESATSLLHRIRGLAPKPGAYAVLNGEPLKILAAESVPSAPIGAPGEVLDHALTIACGEGALRLVTIQRAGKKPAAAADFLNGTPIAPGTVLA